MFNIARHIVNIFPKLTRTGSENSSRSVRDIETEEKSESKVRRYQMFEDQKGITAAPSWNEE